MKKEEPFLAFQIGTRRNIQSIRAQERPGQSPIGAKMVLDSARRSAMPIRLVIWRKPAEWIAMSQYWPRQLASRQQSKLDDGSLTAAEFVMLATSLPEAGCTGPLCEAARKRSPP